MAAEQIIHGVLLAFHNFALVGCAAAPFYNGNLVTKRSQYGPTLHYELDKVVEDTIQSNAPYCLIFLGVLFTTGVAMPLNHFLFHGAVREMHIVGSVALVLKLVFVFAIAIWGMRIFFSLNPQLKEIFSKFEPGQDPDSALVTQFFQIRAKRKALCDTCFWFAVAVLVFSAFMGFGG